MKIDPYRCAAAAALLINALTAFAQTMEFNSLDRKQGFPALFEGRARYSDRVIGEFSMPAGSTGKVPVMIVMHSSGGISPESTGEWSKFFLQMGVATFVVDSFGPRGIRSTGADQSQLDYAASASDALMALKAVAELPQVDKDKIGVIGFSRGGSAALTSSYPRVRDAVLGGSPAKFALSVVLYGGYVMSGTSTTPTLYLVGDEDDYQTVKATSEFVTDLKKRGNNVTFKVYPDATHGFDIERAPLYAPQAQVWKNCYPRAVDLDTMSFWKDGVQVTPKEYYESLAKCRSYGVNVKFNRAARDDARGLVASFVRKNFGL